jgi:hypothetical protein
MVDIVSLSYELWCHVAWAVGSRVSDVHAVSIQGEVQPHG